MCLTAGLGTQRGRRKAAESANAVGTDDEVIKNFPEQYGSDHIAAQKRLAQQFMVQMPKDPREQRQVVRFMLELIEWHENKNHNNKRKPKGSTD